MNSSRMQASIQRQAQDVLRGRNVPGYDRLRERYVWSSYCFHSHTGGALTAGLLAAGEYPVFTAGIMANGQGYPAGTVLNARDTNINAQNRIPDNQNFLVKEMGVSVDPLRQDVVALDATKMCQGEADPSDVDLILGNTVVVLSYLNVSIPLGLASDFPEAGGPSMVSTSTLDFAGNENVAQTGGGLSEGTNASPWSARQAKSARNGGGIAPAPALRRKFPVPFFLRSGENFRITFEIPRSVQLRSVANGGTGGFSLRCDFWVVESYKSAG